MGPYFNFKLPRLFARTGKVFFSYKDPYSDTGSPYAYFRAGPAGKYNPGDAHLGVSPYLKTAVPSKTYHNPESYQIISAGRDGQFGPGGVWTPTSADSIDPKGADDQANFHTALLSSRG